MARRCRCARPGVGEAGAPAARRRRRPAPRRSAAAPRSCRRPAGRSPVVVDEQLRRRDQRQARRSAPLGAQLGRARAPRCRTCGARLSTSSLSKLWLISRSTYQTTPSTHSQPDAADPDDQGARQPAGERIARPSSAPACCRKPSFTSSSSRARTTAGSPGRAGSGCGCAPSLRRRRLMKTSSVLLSASSLEAVERVLQRLAGVDALGPRRHHAQQRPFLLRQRDRHAVLAHQVARQVDLAACRAAAPASCCRCARRSTARRRASSSAGS